MIQEVEKLLRDAGKPYIAVDEAKKALFHGAKLKSFHFVVYFADGRNWLVCCGERGTFNLSEMKQWANIFGDGFLAVFAVRRKACRKPCIRFVDADGKRLNLPDKSDGGATEAHPIDPHPTKNAERRLGSVRASAGMGGCGFESHPSQMNLWVSS